MVIFMSKSLIVVGDGDAPIEHARSLPLERARLQTPRKRSATMCSRGRCTSLMSPPTLDTIACAKRKVVHFISLKWPARENERR